MKKIIMFAMLVVLALTFTACGNSVSQADYNKLLDEVNRLNSANSTDDVVSNYDTSSVDSTPSVDDTSSVESTEDDYDYIGIHSEPKWEPEVSIKNDNYINGKVYIGGRDWIVIDIKDDKKFVISEDAVAYEPLHHTSFQGFTADVIITWETCDIRQYLNNKFYNTFTTTEQNRIIETTNTIDMRFINAVNNKYYAGDDITEVVDKVFLLSKEEVEQYLIYETDLKSKFLKPVKYNNHREISWWTRTIRTPSNGDADAYYYSTYYNHMPITITFAKGIRPAMWITLK